MIVTTTQDLEEIGNCGCPCPRVTCAAPRVECQAIRGTATSAGIFKPGEVAWQIYTTKNTVVTLSQAYSYPDESWSSAASDSAGDQYNRLFNGRIGEGGEGCFTWTATSSEICESSGTGTNNFYLLEDGERGELYSTYQIDRTDISGTESQAHQEWEVAHPDFEAEMAAWQAAHDAWVIAHAAWVIAHAEWVAGGEVGDPPEEPVEPVEPDAEPDQNYPPCTYKDTTVFTLHMDVPPTVATTYEVGANITTVYSRTSGGTTDSTVYLGGQTYAAWIEATKEAMLVEMTFPKDDCLELEGCKSTLTVDPDTEPETHGMEVSLEILKARFRLAPPLGFSTAEAPRSVYEAQFDFGFFPLGHDKTINDPEVTPPDPLPDGWEHPQIPDPDAPAPSKLSSESWIWDGDMEAPWSDYWDVPMPPAKGEVRRVNLLIVCYHSARLGVKPTAHGEQYVFADPPPP